MCVYAAFVFATQLNVPPVACHKTKARRLHRQQTLAYTHTHVYTYIYICLYTQFELPTALFVEALTRSYNIATYSPLHCTRIRILLKLKKIKIHTILQFAFVCVYFLFGPLIHLLFHPILRRCNRQNIFYVCNQILIVP